MQIEYSEILVKEESMFLDLNKNYKPILYCLRELQAAINIIQLHINIATKEQGEQTCAKGLAKISVLLNFAEHI